MANIDNCYDFTIETLNVAACAFSEFGAIDRKINSALNLPLSDEFKSLLLHKKIRDRFLEFKEADILVIQKENEQYTRYQRMENSIFRGYENDRVFPLETVEIQHYRNEHESELEDVFVHTGPYADEYTRSYNALAIAVATDIFFRSNAYSTGTEEGRKTLAHELTHVVQYQEGRITNNSDHEELEEEATTAEGMACSNDNPYYVFHAGKGLCWIKKTEIKQFIDQVSDAIEEKIESQRHILGEERYLRFLLEYETMLKEVR